MAELSPLRRRMIEDMTVRNLSPATRQSYLNPLLKFSRYFGRSPDHLGLEDVHAFQVHLVATGISWPALNQIVCALRLLEPRGPVQEHHLTACEFAKLDRHAGRFVLLDLHCNNSEAGILQLCNEGGTDPGVFDQNRRWRMTSRVRDRHGFERGVVEAPPYHVDEKVFVLTNMPGGADRPIVFLSRFRRRVPGLQNVR